MILTTPPRLCLGVPLAAGSRPSGAATERRKTFSETRNLNGGHENGLRFRSVSRAQISSDSSDIQEVELVRAPRGHPVLFYLPGADGTAGGLTPHMRALQAHGFSVRCAIIPSSNRFGWRQLTDAVSPMLMKANRDANGQGVVVVAESFGACLALRLGLACPQAIAHLVLINSATAFNAALAGLPSLIGQTGLLSAFPEPLFKVAQSIVLPFLINPERADPNASNIFRSMMSMSNSSTDALLDSLEHPASSTIGQSRPVATGGAARPGSRAIPPPGPLGISTHAPAAATDFRIQLMRGGDLTDSRLAQIQVNTVIVSSARDRLFPSMSEGARLQRVIPGAKRVILPESGHAPLLERTVCLLDLLVRIQVTSSDPFRGAHDSSPVPPALRGAQRRSDGPGAELRGTIRTKDTAGLSQTVDVSDSTHASEHGNSSRARSIQAAGWGHSYGWSESDPPANKSDTPPPINFGVLDAGLETGFESFRAWRDIISPVLLGLENLPPPAVPATGAAAGRPLLFVGNHTQFGMYDMPLLFMEMYTRGYVLTGLADPDHWKTPLGPFFETFGAVKAGPMPAFRALRDGKNVLLFPGGGREVSKNRDEYYKLFWPPSADFARLAAATNATIVPFSAIGGDDAFDIAMDPADILSHPVLAPLATAAVDTLVSEGRNPSEVVMPLTRLPGSPIPSPLPVANFGRVYFKFGEPVDMAEVPSKDRAACRAAGAVARRRVEEGIAELLEVREGDPDRGVLRRVQRKAVQAVSLASQL